MEVSILGTKYEINYQTEEENPKLETANGICEVYSKQIVIREIKPDKMSYDNIDEYKNKVLRHEIIHAYFAESGLRTNSDYAENEELVDWIAIQIPKIVQSMKDAGCL